MGGTFISHNFIIGPTDTDSISFCKPDMTPFTDEESEQLLKEINEISPELIHWEDDGYYPVVIAFKAKNYVLYDGEKITYKGSALKSSKLEPALKEMQQRLIDAIIHDKMDTMVDIYESYVDEVRNITDIKRWCQKKTWTDKITRCKGHENMTKEEKKEKGIRKNESDILDAAGDRILQEGDKIYVYPAIVRTEVETKTSAKGKVTEKVKQITGLKIAEDWNDDHDKSKLFKRLFDNVKLFGTIMDISVFKNYTKE